MKINVISIVLSGLIVSSSICLPATASTDLKAWSGSMCDAFYGSQTSRFDKTYYGIKNTSSVASWITCGVLDDQYPALYPDLISGAPYAHWFPEYGDETGTGQAWAYIKAPAASESVCFLSERRQQGEEVFTTVDTVTGSGSLQIITSKSDAFGHRVFMCKLPPNATLTQVVVSDPGNTEEAR